MSGDDDNDVTYSQSKQQKKIFKEILPIIRMLGAAGKQGMGVWPVLSPESMMPTKSWWENISPQVMQGIQAPYNLASRQLEAQLASKGQLGSARGGVSGAAAAGMGKFWENAAQGMGQQAWAMTGPQLQTAWQTAQHSLAYPFTALPALLGGTYPYPVIPGQQQSPWASALGALGGLGAMGLSKMF